MFSLLDPYCMLNVWSRSTKLDKIYIIWFQHNTLPNTAAIARLFLSSFGRNLSKQRGQFILSFQHPFNRQLYIQNAMNPFIAINHIIFWSPMTEGDGLCAAGVPWIDLLLSREPLLARKHFVGQCFLSVAVKTTRILSHYCDVIMGVMASQINSLTIVYSTFIQVQIKENINAQRHWPLCGEFTGDRWIPRTNGQ